MDSKHVIFLGAGASQTSGYPLADELREWIASPHNRVIKALETSQQWQNMGTQKRNQITQQLSSWIESLKDALELFRSGCFGTVDEFCYLAKDARATEVAQLKKLLRLMLACIHPEEKWLASDYYRFIQQIFDKDLHSLRKDIVVMSFNYDPYLEWLLRRAVGVRHRVILQEPGRTPSFDFTTDSLVTSGFSGGQAGLRAISEKDGFCLLKLHGVIAWPNPGNEFQMAVRPHCFFKHLFDLPMLERLMTLTSIVGGDIGQSVPPIVFPWEIMKEDGTFIDEGYFPHKDEVIELQDHIWREGGRGPLDPNLYRLFEAIWTRAQQEVRVATKISFVGLSMHEYLNWGFKFLFRDKEGPVDVVVTDKDGPRTSGGYFNHDQLDASSAPARVLRLLESLCPKIRWNVGAPYLANDGTDIGPPSSAPNRVKVVSSFDEFILKEIGQRS